MEGGRRGRHRLRVPPHGPWHWLVMVQGAGERLVGRLGPRREGPKVWVSRGKLRSWAHGRSLKYMAFGDIVPS